MHAEVFAFVENLLDVLPRRGHVVELGSRNVNGSIRPWFANASSYIGVDLVAGPGVDVVADGATYQPEDSPELVLCCEVLEHTPEASAIVANAARMLTPDGWLLITCATDPRTPHSAVDGGALRAGEFYANVPPGDLYAWITDNGLTIKRYEIRADVGDLRLLAWKP